MELTTHVSVSLRALGTSNGRYRTLFLVATGATVSMAPSSELIKAGIKPIGRMSYELADGTVHEYGFGLAEIEFMGEITAGRVIFGPEGIEPILGVTALDSVGITIDPTTRTLKRLPAVPLKSCLVIRAAVRPSDRGAPRVGPAHMRPRQR